MRLLSAAKLLLCFFGSVTEATSLIPRSPYSLSPEVEAVCSLIRSQYPNLLAWDPAGPHGFESVGLTSAYNEAVSSYISLASVNQRPACILFPSDAQQVSYAVRTLNLHPEVRFGLKSGGHNGNLGFSTALGGLLIAFRPNSLFAVPAKDGQSVLVGAGCKWKDVYAALQPLGKAAVGARYDNVGVTGYILGGGLSFLSSQYGFACDNVLSFECVLGDGSIVTASPSSHPDLYFALRGGGNQFAIVTRMTLRTYDVGQKGIVWGGVRLYDVSKRNRLLAAISKFTGNSSSDVKAAIFPIFNFGAVVGAHFPFVVVTFFYDGPQPGSNIFRPFDGIPSLYGDTGPTTYRDLHAKFLGGNIRGLNVVYRVNTFPNMPPAIMSSFLRRHYKMLEKAAANASNGDLIDAKVFSFEVQPVPHSIAEASLRIGGGNALSLDPKHGDRVWITYLYNPIFMNHAMYDQKVLQSYGNETYGRLKAIQKRYDSAGLFSKRQGGFHFED
ncbi:hypothetical protein CDD80_6485 [Ophiocordyceps camponoti-rufipedis]|uniref:FAD-binding PCMH-type domain-containing protein n=1 Tax=Ophiocordyceps camponoti-rufipedis TaxID=2004952 RepID=A0A2C5ZFL6_9HYPO|nr:hypothetical protein CDD80_6485 [Ophiocordyceps camponoti-rufipedis]